LDAVLEIDSLSKEFRIGKRSVLALKGVSLQIKAGEIVGLLGPNGAGKTTLIKCTCGLIIPDGGQISLMGYDPVRERTASLQRLGAVLEGSRNVYWQLSPRENLEYFGQMRGLHRKTIRIRSAQLFERLGLTAVQDRPVKELSRGTQQRVAVAASLVHDPPLCLLDEPTLGLDVESAEAVASEVLRMARQDGKAILLTTHQLELAERLCDRVAIIRGGELLRFEPKENLLRELESQRMTSIKISGNLQSKDREHLSSTYLGFRYVNEGDSSTLSIHTAEQPEELFLYLWRAGYTIHNYTRRGSLHDAYLWLVGEGQSAASQNDKS